jgi:integrating conjugative element protein (TIGR03765 family)
VTSKGLRLSRGVGLILIATRAWGTPVVIFDTGHTKPIAPYYESLAGGAGKGRRPPEVRRPGWQNPTVGLPVRRALEARDVLPIHTAEMRPGRVESRFIATRLPRPLFLVGADADSLHWLTVHRTKLLEMRATGMLVEAATVDELRAVANATQGLPMVPASASDIARTLGIVHYPVLITPEGIEQ